MIASRAAGLAGSRSLLVWSSVCVAVMWQKHQRLELLSSFLVSLLRCALSSVLCPTRGWHIPPFGRLALCRGKKAGHGAASFETYLYCLLFFPLRSVSSGSDVALIMDYYFCSKGFLLKTPCL